MAQKNNKGGSSLALGAVVGAVAGVVAGILFAPKSGKETREDIKKVTSDTTHAVKDEAEKLHAEAKDLIEKVEIKAKGSRGKASEGAKQHAQDAKKQIKNAATVLQAVKVGKASDKDLQSAIKQLKGVRTSLKAFLAK